MGVVDELQDQVRGGVYWMIGKEWVVWCFEAWNVAVW